VHELSPAIQSISKLSDDCNKKFTSVWKHQIIAKDHHLLRENMVSDYLFYCKKGILRIYYYKNGKEVTEWIAMNSTFCFSIISFFERIPSKLIIHAIEPSEIYALHHDDLMRLCSEEHEIERWLRKTVTSSLILSQHRMESIQFETAQQRYDSLLKKKPQIIQRVPLAYIASFLGITQETLSRIRANH
jgi:CRP-like cAMP-binding protein